MDLLAATFYPAPGASEENRLDVDDCNRFSDVGTLVEIADICSRYGCVATLVDNHTNRPAGTVAADGT